MSEQNKKQGSLLKPAFTLGIITLLSGLALSGTYALTKDAIAEQKLSANAASYKEVMQDADSFKENSAMTDAIAALGGEIYGTDFGKAYINSAVDAFDASGNEIGTIISATSGDGFDGNITLSVGIASDGSITGLAFTELHETAGMGMRCDEDAFKGQFTGRNAAKFNLNKAGGSTAEDEIDSVSGASISSGAVVNAVNAALDFYAASGK